jgi:hypothetical protein
MWASILIAIPIFSNHIGNVGVIRPYPLPSVARTH